MLLDIEYFIENKKSNSKGLRHSLSSWSPPICGWDSGHPQEIGKRHIEGGGESEVSDSIGWWTFWALYIIQKFSGEHSQGVAGGGIGNHCDTAFQWWLWHRSRPPSRFTLPISRARRILMRERVREDWKFCFLSFWFVEFRFPFLAQLGLYLFPRSSDGPSESLICIPPTSLSWSLVLVFCKCWKVCEHYCNFIFSL